MKYNEDLKTIIDYTDTSMNGSMIQGKIPKSEKRKDLYG